MPRLLKTNASLYSLGRILPSLAVFSIHWQKSNQDPSLNSPDDFLKDFNSVLLGRPEPVQVRDIEDFPSQVSDISGRFYPIPDKTPWLLLTSSAPILIG